MFRVNPKWINKKKEIKKEIEKYNGFELIIDILHKLIDFQMIYCVLLNVYFIAYQNGKAQFQPILYFLFIIYDAIILMLEKFGKFTEVWKLLIWELVTGILFIFIFPIQGTKVFIILTIAALIMESIWRYRYSYSDVAAYSMRFRNLNRMIIKGAFIICIFFIHLLSSVSVSSEFSMNAKVCNCYMIFSFAFFIISWIMYKYAFRFYEYYKQGRQADARGKRQLRHVFFLILFVLSVLVLAIIFVFGTFLTPVLNVAWNWIVRIALSFLMEYLLGWDGLSEKEAASSDQGIGEAGAAVRPEPMFDKSPIMQFVPFLVTVILVIAVVYLVWKLYKTILANYKIEADEAEFISIKEEKSYIDREEKGNAIKFGKTNKEKIRKIYINIINKRKRKLDITILPEHTPKEIKTLLAYKEEKEKLADELTEIYEKARYSNQECTQEDVEKVKALNEKL